MIVIRNYIHLFLIINEIILSPLLLVIFILSLISNKYESIWIYSKYKTVIEILENNMSAYYPLQSINSNLANSLHFGEYKNFLTHSTRDECEKNYKKCGILDTYGNIMCIPKRKTCPINEIIIDLESKSNEYIEKGYYSVKISKLPDNYLLYYTNKSIDKEILVYLTFNDEYPKYITYQNLILNMSIEDEYKNCRNAIINKTDSLYINNEDDYSNKIKKDKNGLGGINDIGLNLRYLKSDERVDDYINKKIYDSSNIDKYYIKVFDNIYIKNYIGFESYENMLIFMNFNFNSLYYSKRFPNIVAGIFGLFSFIILIFLIVISFRRLLNKNCCITYNYKSIITLITIISVIFLSLYIGYFTYFIKIYNEMNDNYKCSLLNLVKSDKFVENFIKEICYPIKKNNRLIFAGFFLLLISLFYLFLVGFLLLLYFFLIK